MELGKINQLKINRLESVGAYLIDDEGNEVLLPNRYVPTHPKIGQDIDVFIYHDSEDRLVATTLTPHAQVNQFACMKVVDTAGAGAFLDWGLAKDLLVPHKEQKSHMRVGKWYLVFVYEDSLTNRLVASAKTQRYFNKQVEELEIGQEVDILIAETTVNGILVVVDNQYQGLIFENEVFQDLPKGEHMRGFVKNIREDGKLDISLRKTGMDNISEGAERILKELKANNGFIPLTDKSDPQHIQDWFEMSKKNFKRSLGTLYKQRIVSIEEDGIRLKKD